MSDDDVFEVQRLYPQICLWTYSDNRFVSHLAGKALRRKLIALAEM